MNSNPIKLSVVIPFYNVEKYISECLDSVYAQDIPECEYEVICVDDCSPDNSRQIVFEYQKKHQNLTLIEHETNKMLGAARNTGLHAAQGKYVWFIDSDDYIKPHVFSNLLNLAESDNLEILYFNLLKISNEGVVLSEEFKNKETDVITGFKLLLSDVKFNISTCIKIFDKSFLISNNLFYPEGVYYEDVVHAYKSFLRCYRVKYISEFNYFYRFNESSILNKGLTGKKMINHLRYNMDLITLFSDNFQESPDYFNGHILYNVKRIKRAKKVVMLLSIKERRIFFDNIDTLNMRAFKDYFGVLDYFFYFNPKTAMFLSIFLSPIVSFVIKSKRKYQTNKVETKQKKWLQNQKK